MFPRFRFAFQIAAVCGGALLISSAHAAPAPLKPVATAPVIAKTPAKVATKIAATSMLKLDGWNYAMADEPLENRWSFRAQPTSDKAGEARAVFGWKDARNFALLRVTAAQIELWQIENGAARKLGQSARIIDADSAIGLQVQGERVRVLSGNARAIEAKLKLAGAGFGEATQGGFGWDAGDVQPTEAAVFRDDFMRAQGPDDAEVPSEWEVEGNWKTSGALRPRADDALNPNPFLFRASLPQSAPVEASNKAQTIARAGHWFWSDYALTASLRATDNNDGAPLMAALEAFGDKDNAGLVGEIDFRAHVARIKIGDKVLAQSAPFDTETGQWHRVRLEPGPGTARLVIDGIERVRAENVKLAQGAIALRAQGGGANVVDFDDVWVAPVGDKKGWGEGSLPERFQKDRLMKNWASAAAAWKRGADGTWWHTGDFFGDSQVSLPIPTLQDGSGFEIVVGAKEGAPETASMRFKVERKGEEILMGGRSWPLSEAMGATLTLENHVRDGQLNPTEALHNGHVFSVNFSTAGKMSGTKIGVTPLQNGAPLGAVAPEKIALTSATFERDGSAVIGVNITPVTAQIARENGLPQAVGAIVDNVEAGSPAQRAGVRNGDVVVGVNGTAVTDVDSMKAAVGAVHAGETVKLALLRARRDGSGIDWENALASTPAMLDYSFTTAPTDWRAARGRWEVAERWTCSPQWSFFGGGNSDAPLLWSRFQTQGDWTLEAYLATPMDMARGERSPVDLNVGVGGDGRDLASGYSFGFGTDARQHNTIWRGDKVALQKDFEMPPGTGETHQDWFYVRLEKRQLGKVAHFKWSVNGREIADYTDDNPLPDGGHLAFWSKNGGISIARMRLWNSGLTAPKSAPFDPMPQMREIENPLGKWSARGVGDDVSALVLPVVAPRAQTGDNSIHIDSLKIINPQSGGDWTTYISRAPFSAARHPILSWNYKMDAGVKLNLYAKIGGNWREIAWSGGQSAGAKAKPLGALDAIADGNWHRARFDLLAALRAQGLADQTIEALALAAPDRDYLRAGLGGNHLGATLEVRDFAAPVLVAQAFSSSE